MGTRASETERERERREGDREREGEREKGGRQRERERGREREKGGRNKEREGGRERDTEKQREGKMDCQESSFVDTSLSLLCGVRERGRETG